MARAYSLRNAGVMLDEVKQGVRAAAKRGLLAAAHRVVERIQTDPALPVDKGIYKAGWRAKATAEGALVYNAVPYAAFIEYGVRAANVKIGRDMIQALAEWVRRKGIGGTQSKGRGGVVRYRKASMVEATAIAWAIAKAMQRRGIFNHGRGLRILERAERGIPALIREEVLRELRGV